MGQLSGKLEKRPVTPITMMLSKDANNSKNKPPVALHAMFNPEKLAKLSDRLGEISLNQIEGNNGLVFQDKFIPEELLAEILGYIDYKSLIVCQLVCKQWFLTIRGTVWRRKAEKLLHRPLPLDEAALWTIFYAVCDKKIPFSKNLIKHDTQVMASNWCDMEARFSWTITHKHFRAPKDPMFNGDSIRYLFNEQRCLKRQVVNLLHLGFPQYLLDNAQPTIKISEWYRCRRDSPGLYECKIELIKLEDAGDDFKYLKYTDVILDSYNFTKTFENRNHRGTWRKFKYEFRNYGKGLNRIRFYHGGQNHIEIGGTRITIEFPKKLKNNNRNV